MSRRTHLLFVASLFATAVLAAPMPMVRTTLPGKPGVLAMHADHAVMLRAIRRARAELPDFLELAESPRSNMSRISVRVSLRERNEAEYIWVTDFKQGDTALFAGVVEGRIFMKSRFTTGDPFTFVRGDIIDWTYTDTRSGKVHGAYTECALLTLAKEADARPIRAKHESNCEF